MTPKKDLTNVQHLFDQHIQNTQIGFTTIIRNHLVAASRLQKSQLEIILEEMEDITSSCPVMEVLSHQRYQSATVANIQKEAKWSCQLANRKLQFLTKNIKRNKQPATSPPAPAPAPAPAATLPVVLPPIAVQPKLPQPENTPPPPQAVTTTSTPRPTTARVPPPDEHHRSWTGDPLPPAQELEIQLNARTEVADSAIHHSSFCHPPGQSQSRSRVKEKDPNTILWDILWTKSTSWLLHQTCQQA